MVRIVIPVAWLIASMLCLVSAQGQQTNSHSVQLRVLLPEDDAVVLIDGNKTKQTGVNRLYVSPPLDAGWTYTYSVTAKWEPNNYTEVIRTRTVQVKAGQEVVIDLRKSDDKYPDKFEIRYVPTPEDVVEAMCKLAKVGKDDVVYDLGCGDGRIVITAVKDFGAKRGVGVDLNERLVRTSTEEAKKAKVDDRVAFRKQDVLDIKDLSDASVVMMYMGEDVNLRLMPILKKSLKVGSRIVSHDFKMGDWRPDEKITLFSEEDGDDHVLYLWTIK